MYYSTHTWQACSECRPLFARRKPMNDRLAPCSANVATAEHNHRNQNCSLASRTRDEVINRRKKCPNSRENGTSLPPRPQKTPFRRSLYLVTIRQLAKTPRQTAQFRAQAKRTQHENREEIECLEAIQSHDPRPSANQETTATQPFFIGWAAAFG
jgi:hypothetical protein